MRTQRHPIADKVLDRSLEDLRALLDRVSASPLWDGVLVVVQLKDATATDVITRLGRKWRGWILVSLRGASSSGRIQDATSSDDTKFLRLTANGYGATITAGLWIF